MLPQKKLLFLLFTALLIGCGGGGGGTSNSIYTIPTQTASGIVEKGPFVSGSLITINLLDEQGLETGVSQLVSTGPELGAFTFTAESNQLLLFSARGRFRNEITGRISSKEITLQALYRYTPQFNSSVSINVLTHLTSARALHLIRTENLSYEDAIQQAETEFLLEFSDVIQNTSEQRFNSISIFSRSQATPSAYLLLTSAILYKKALESSNNNLTAAEDELTTLLNQLISDFSDGVFNDNTLLTSLRTVQTRLDPQEINSQLAEMLQGRAGFSISDIDTYLDTDLDGSPNHLDTDDDNDLILDDLDSNPIFSNTPTISGSPPDSVLARTEFTFTPNVDHIGSESLVFTVQNLPTWAVFVPSNGRISGIPGDSDIGTYPNIKVSVSNGFISNELNSFGVSVLSNPWFSISNLPENYLWSSSASALDSTAIYISGGYYNFESNPITAYRPSLFLYSPATDSWDLSLQNMSTPRASHTTDIINGTLIVTGGQNQSGTLDSVESYDIANDIWAAKSAMSIPRTYHASCIHNGKIYVFGGATVNPDNPGGTLPTETAEVYDPLNDSWSAIASLDQANAYSRCVSLNGLIYVIGGEGNPSEFDVYDPVSDAWLSSGILPTSRTFGFQASVINGEIYIFGGSSLLTRYSTRVDIYNPVSNTWRIGTEMPIGQGSFASAATNEMIYFFGGKIPSTGSFSEIFTNRSGFYNSSLEPAD